MQTPSKISKSVITILFFIGAFILIPCLSFSQKIRNQHREVRAQKKLYTTSTITDTIPKNKSIYLQKIRLNPALNKIFLTRSIADTLWDLEKYLDAKKDCDFEKTIDNDGCIIVKYNDGFIKKVCDDYTVEIITPDGKRHVSRYGRQTMMMEVIPIPIPPDPLETDNSYRWINSYNGHLLNDIGNYLIDSNLIHHYLLKEQAQTNGSVYKQIQYRTIFIEQFLKAR